VGGVGEGVREGCGRCEGGEGVREGCVREGCVGRVSCVWKSMDMDSPTHYYSAVFWTSCMDPP
jgi:hypothetical protein